MAAKQSRSGPPGAVPVLHYDELLAARPREGIIAALRAALGHHEPERYEEWGGGWRCQCRDKGGTRRLWPCPEVRSVVAALAGEEAAA
jgi:phage baseplate assembly protein gpV